MDPSKTLSFIANTRKFSQGELRHDAENCIIEGFSGVRNRGHEYGL